MSDRCNCIARNTNKRHRCYCPLYVPVKPKWIPRDLLRVAREDRAAEVRLRGEERVAELEREANK